MPKIFLLCSLLFSTFTSPGQLLDYKRFHPGTTNIKTFYAKDFRSVEKLDSLGRRVEKTVFRKKTMSTKTIYKYNIHSDIIMEVVVYDVNRPQQTDTTTYEYVYINNKIVVEKYIPARHKEDSMIFRLVKNDGDSILTYKRLHYRENKEMQPREEIYTLTWKNDFMVSKEVISEILGERITRYEYFPNGLVKHKVEQSISGMEGKIVYAGGYTSDNQFYSYKYDRKGRVKAMYTTYDNRTHKMMTHRYR